MEFTLVCAKAIPVFNQAIKTCDTKSSATDADFLFREDDGNLWITSINKNTEQTILLPTESLNSKPQVNFFVNGTNICEIFRQFPDESATCKYENNVLVIKGTVRDISIELPTSPADDFASFSHFMESPPVECDAQHFKNSLKLTAFSASKDDAYDSLVGVHVVLANNKFVAESSDSERISVSEIETDTGLNDVSFLLPKESSDIIMGLLDKVETIKIEKGKRTIRFYWGNTTFTSRLICDIDEEYPNVQQYMNGSIVASIDISRQELLNCLKLMGLLVKDSSVTLKCSKDGLRVIANEKDKGSATNLIEPQSVTGTAESCVPYRYLVNVAGILDAAWITIDFVELTSVPVANICIKEDCYKHFIFASSPKE